ncbi:hypothetical protein E3N88_03249 [Mikania micrantha]|uniref:Uncharacterized protein n=1 Tax=Mikania micrantha TaxID=192012 RepID=A0A5N6Q6G8_9ASTR|nr:hypothetical protein E3N88_03249 [Mikania micrantha]
MNMMSCPIIKPVVVDTFFSAPSSPSSITGATTNKFRELRRKLRAHIGHGLRTGMELYEIESPVRERPFPFGPVVDEEGFEPPTPWFVATCSNPLSYRPHCVSTRSVPGNGECPIELIGSCRNKVQVYRSVRMPQLHTSLYFHLTPIVMINGSSHRDLLLNSQNFCRSIPAGAENPSLSRLCYRRLWGSRNRRALILGWAYYLDAFSSYPLRTWLLSVYRGHDNWYTRGASFPLTYRFNGRTTQPLEHTTAPSGEEPTSRANLRPARGNLCTPPLPFGRPTPHRNCLPETVPWPTQWRWNLRDDQHIFDGFVNVLKDRYPDIMNEFREASKGKAREDGHVIPHGEERFDITCNYPPDNVPLERRQRLCKIWNTDKWLNRSKVGRNNRKTDLSRHTGGSMGFDKHRIHLEKQKGKTVGFELVFIDTHATKDTKKRLRSGEINTNDLDELEFVTSRSKESFLGNPTCILLWMSLSLLQASKASDQ